MRCFFLSVLWMIAFCFPATSNAQDVFTVKGRVLDEATGEPLAAASVVAQNTTAGTLTDSTGNFRLKLNDGGYTVTISYTGYQSKDIRVTGRSAQEDMVIMLEPRPNALEEISVVLDLEVKDGWENYGQFFIENFIGRTYFSKACVIRNPEVLRFYFYKKRKTLKVLAREPLIVENFALGYTLSFTIDSFTNNFDTRTSMFVGYPVFKEMTGTPEQENIWSRNRFSVYYGSSLHFMRMLYQKKLQQEGYELKFIFKTPVEEVPITVKDIYSALNYNKDSSGTVHVRPLQNEVAVIYHRETPEVAYLMIEPTANKKFQISTFVFNPKDPISIEKNGYYSPQEEIITNGYLGFKKIADMLPYDYEPLPTQ